ncbi:MAG: PKD-like domain-containing protein, partial [Bacteroidota bacterium]
MRERNSQVSNYLTPITFSVLLRTALTPFFLFLCLGLALAQPSNDDCNTDISVPTDGSCVDGNNTLATPDVGNGSCVNGGGGAPNVWFSFVADGMDYEISVIGLGGSAEITLIQFQGIPCDFGSAVEIDCGPGDIVGNNVLMAGQQYYISVTSSNGTEGPFSICVDNPADPPAPPNDDPCSPIGVPTDGSCTTGTTLNGNQDWSNPNCPNLGETSVWYQITLDANSNSVEINIGNQTITGDVSVMIGTFNPDCTGGFLFNAQYCGPASGNFEATGLMGGGTYWVVVSTEEANAGIFDICITEMGPPPACAAIDDCSGAQDISTSAGMTNCVTGCNTGTSPDNIGGGGCFDFSAIPTVWYTFTTDNNTDFVNIDLNSPSFDLPQIAVLQGDCAGFAVVDCINGAGGTANLLQVDVAQNTTYYIAVGSVGGQDGDFNLCLSTVPSGGTNCNVGTTFNVTNTSLGSPPSGPFQAGEEVTICIDVNYSAANNNCQWLHGLVPEFGGCWDEDLSFNPDGSPINVTLPGGATWNWYSDGDVVYNDVPGGIFGQGDPVGAGWFVTGVTPGAYPPGCGPGSEFSDPNCSWGVPMGCGTQQAFQFCVTLTTKSYPACDASPESINCGIIIRTFGDGETGGWTQTGCQLDVPWNYNASLNCCDPPDILPLPATACSGEQIDIFLDDFLVPPTQPGDVTYTWTVSAPGGVTGASSCTGGCGNILSQILTNSTSSPQIVTYSITPRTIDGCVGLPTDLQITVLPEIVPTITNPAGAVCSGQCVTLFGGATGGAPPYNYEWSTGDFGLTTQVCPTFTTSYFLTVTDGNDCSAVEEILVEANPNLDVTIVATPNITEICESDPQFPIQLTAFADIGGPAWIYNWELATGATPSIPIVQATADGLYCVTLTDANGCTGEDCIQITVYPEPQLILFPVDPVCQNSGPVPLTVVTVPTGGTGSWSGNINADGNFVPDIAGVNTVCYDFTDDNGCPAQECMDIVVNPVPGAPAFNTFVADVCSDQTGITYCVDPVASADGYVWTFPPGVTITSDPTQDCVTVDWNGAPAGDVCVTATNACGSSPAVCQPVTVNSAPPAPTDLGGPLTPCANETGLTYNISAVAGATTYTWTVTGGTITAGQGTTSITVDWGTAAGTVCVTADNSCGSSAPACLNIDPNSPPAAPLAINDPGAVCAGDNNVAYSIAAVPNASSYNWTVPAGATFTGNGTTSIIVDWGSSVGGDICVNAENVCGVSPNT